MKRSVFFTIMLAALFALSGCKALNKAGFTTADAVKVGKGLVNMSFGSGANGPFEVSKTTIADSTLVIQNDTDRTITVKVTGNTNKTFTVTSGKSDSAVVKPGSYHFEATAPGTNGCKGDSKLDGFNQYKWIFVIR